ncbi:MAG: ParA family protein [Planctomycetota bacterium]|jgi:chromosome partitioning protein
MRKIAVINQKGGVGKTTTTANLGAALGRAGWRVLLIDLDPQGHLSLHFGIQVTDEQVSTYDMLTDGLGIQDIVEPVRDNIVIAPADIHLAGAEAELVSIMGREVILREALEKVEDEYDYMLIDCPPSVGVLTINALAAADQVLIPLQAQFFALQGFAKLLEKTVTLVHRRINNPLTVLGVILCLHERATRLAGEVVEDIRLFLDAGRGTRVPWSNAKLFETPIRRNIKLAEACSFGKSIFDYAPRSNGALDYLFLAHEIFPEAGIAIPGWMKNKQGTGRSAESHELRIAPVEEVASTGSEPANVEGNSTAQEVESPGPPEDERSATPPRPPRVDPAIGTEAPVSLPPARRMVQPGGLPTPESASIPRTIPVIDARDSSVSREAGGSHNINRLR